MLLALSAAPLTALLAWLVFWEVAVFFDYSPFGATTRFFPPVVWLTATFNMITDFSSFEVFSVTCDLSSIFFSSI